jgi:hypothetical protein
MRPLQSDLYYSAEQMFWQIWLYMGVFEMLD